MARKMASKGEAAAFASANGHRFRNDDEADQARYKAALGLPLDAHINHEVVLRLVEIVVELDQRLEALEKK